MDLVTQPFCRRHLLIDAIITTEAGKAEIQITQDGSGYQCRFWREGQPRGAVRLEPDGCECPEALVAMAIQEKERIDFLRNEDGPVPMPETVNAVFHGLLIALLISLAMFGALCPLISWIVRGKVWPW